MLAPLTFIGADVAYPQTSVDFGQYDAELIIIKATEGAGITDPYWPARFAEARAAGVKFRGVYHFLTHDDADAQIAHFAAALAPILPLQPGEFLALDWEKSGGVEVGADVLDRALVLAASITPDRSVWIYGYYSMLSRLVGQYPDHPRWIASGDVPDYAYEVGAVLDQYGISHEVAGIASGVDVNRIIDYAALERLTLKETMLDLTQTVEAHPAGDRTKALASFNLHDYLVYLLDCANNAEAHAAEALAAVRALPAQSATATVTIDYTALAKAVADELAKRLVA